MPLSGAGHEIATNRLTLIQREPNHVTLTFVVDYVDLLHKTLAPAASRAEFAIACSGMSDPELRRRLLQAQSAIEGGIVIRTPRTGPLPRKPLRWPEFATAQRLLREAAMGSIVGAADHAHQDPVEIQGDLVASFPIDELALRLPPMLGEVIVVSYRPRQVRVDAAAAASTVVKF